MTIAILIISIVILIESTFRTYYAFLRWRDRYWSEKKYEKDRQKYGGNK